MTTNRRSLIVLAMLVCGTPSAALAEDNSKNEASIQLAEVPRPALTAARKELDAQPTSAKILSYEGQTAYKLQGTNRYDKRLSVVVAAGGKVLKPVNIWDADDD